MKKRFLSSIFSSILFLALAVSCPAAELSEKEQLEVALAMSLDLAQAAAVADLSNDAIRQQGATCGFHAIYNAVALLKYFSLDGDEATAKQVLQVQPDYDARFPLACWQAKVEARGNIDESAINTILTKGDLGISRDCITIIPEVHTFAPTRLLFDQARPLTQFLQDFKIGNPCMHAFILGNMNGATRTDGHWVAVVVWQKYEDIARYYYVDSLGENAAARDRFIESLKNNVLIDPDKVQIATTLDGRLCAARELIGRKELNPNEYPGQDKASDYKRAFELLRAAYQQIQRDNLHQSPVFIEQHIQELKTLAQEIATKGKINTDEFYAQLDSDKQRLDQQREQERIFAEEQEKRRAEDEQSEKAIDDFFNEQLAEFMGIVFGGDRKLIDERHAELITTWQNDDKRVIAIEQAHNEQ